MRLGLFGGTFDPVHYGHLLLAECCREQCRLDRVLFLPAAVPPHKQDRALTPAADRIEMLRLAIAGNDAMAVDSYEIDRGGISFTVDTLRHLKSEHFGVERSEGAASAELFFLMGADMLADLPHWREAAEVCRLCVPVVVPRPMCPLDFAPLAGIATAEQIELIRRHQVEMPLVGISSSDIRRRVAAGLSIRYRTPRAVEKYIEIHGLYG
jgi:nicotinate-nucleotide adenylyltransferase